MVFTYTHRCTKSDSPLITLWMKPVDPHKYEEEEEVGKQVEYWDSFRPDTFLTEAALNEYRGLTQDKTPFIPIEILCRVCATQYPHELPAPQKGAVRIIHQCGPRPPFYLLDVFETKDTPRQLEILSLKEARQIIEARELDDIYEKTGEHSYFLYEYFLVTKCGSCPSFKRKAPVEEKTKSLVPRVPTMQMTRAYEFKTPHIHELCNETIIQCEDTRLLGTWDESKHGVLHVDIHLRLPHYIGIWDRHDTSCLIWVYAKPDEYGVEYKYIAIGHEGVGSRAFSFTTREPILEYYSTFYAEGDEVLTLAATEHYLISLEKQMIMSPIREKNRPTLSEELFTKEFIDSGRTQQGSYTKEQWAKFGITPPVPEGEEVDLEKVPIKEKKQKRSDL